MIRSGLGSRVATQATEEPCTLRALSRKATDAQWPTSLVRLSLNPKPYMISNFSNIEPQLHSKL